MSKGVNGSAKGSTFERKFCKELSLWFSEGKRDDLFWRTSGSGARATVRGKQGKDTANSHGDVCATDEEGKLFTDRICIELKCGYNHLDPMSLLSLKPQKGLIDLINQSQEQCKIQYNMSGKKLIPLLVWKRNNKPALAITTDVSFWSWMMPEVYHLYGYTVKEEILIFEWDQLLESISGGRVKKELINEKQF